MSVFSKLSLLACLVAVASAKGKKHKKWPQTPKANTKADIRVETQTTASADGGYTAAFVEHICVFDEAGDVASVEDARDIIQQNLDILSDAVVEAKDYDSELVLFPEFALTGLVSEREQMSYYLESVGDVGLGDDSTPCNNDDYSDRTTLQALSCMALDNEVYLVVNYGDLVDCDTTTDDSCSDGYYQYNTELVFSNTGELVAKYWKIHTFKEDEYDTPPTMDYTTFEMNGIKFGLFTCYDSMFGTPIIPILMKEGVSDMLISHWWVNDYPRMAAVSWFQSVSRIYGVNLVVASSGWVWESGEARPRWSSGSGLFAAGEVLMDYYDDSDSADFDDYSDYVYEATFPELDGYQGRLAPKHQGIAGPVSETPDPMEYNLVWQEASTGAVIDLSVTVPESDASPEFTCTASGEISEGDDEGTTYVYLYASTGYFDTPDGNNVYFYEQFCSLYVCSNGASNDACFASYKDYDTSTYDESEISFDHISVSANFEMNHVFPMALNGRGANVFNVMTYSEFTQDDSGSTFAFEEFDSEYTPLLSMTMLGRDFSKDVKLVTTTVVAAADEEPVVEAAVAVVAAEAIVPSKKIPDGVVNRRNDDNDDKATDDTDTETADNTVDVVLTPPKVHNGSKMFPNLSSLSSIATVSVLGAIFVSLLVYAWRRKTAKYSSSDNDEYSSLL